MTKASYNIESYGTSDIGLVRNKNEDVYAISDSKTFFVLADGMGGHRAGDVAAKAAVNSLCAIVQELLDESPSLPTEQIKQKIFLAFQEVNRITYRMGQQEPKLKGMGTTLVLLLLMPKGICIGHIGDSRLYRLRNNHLQQLTKDHSLLGELKSMGQIDAKQEENFMYKNILTRAVGTEPTVEPDVLIDSLQKGDHFLLCSDGLTDHFQPEELEELIIKKKNNFKKLTQSLVQLAKKRGGHDNITSILVKVF